MVRGGQIRVACERTKCCLIGQNGGWIGKRDQFSWRIVFLIEESIGFGVDYGQHFAAGNPSHKQAVALDSNDPVLLIEDRVVCGVLHLILDAHDPARDARSQLPEPEENTALIRD